MTEAILRCTCGHAMRVSTFAVGSKGRCPGCGAVVIVREEDLEPMAAPNPGTASTTPESDAGDVCARCGKPYKGDWDRVQSPTGEMCHHCSVLAVEGVPEHTTLAKSWDENLPDPMHDRVRSAAVKPPFTQSDAFKRALMAVAGGMVVLTIVLLTTEGFQVPEAARTTVTEEVELPAWAERALIFWDFIAVVPGWFIGLYAALALLGKLPGATFNENFTPIGIAALALGAVKALIMFLSMIVGFLPLYGLLLGVAGILLTYIILDHFFDYGFIDFIVTLVVHAVLGAIIIGGLKIALGAALYHAVT